MEDIATIYQFFRRAIAAGETARISVYGNYITLLSTTGAANIQMSINGQSMQEIPQGLSVKLPARENFKYLEFYNSEAVAVTIELSLSSGEIGDARASASLLSTLQSIRDDQRSTTGTINAEATVGVAESTLLAANTNRKSLSVQANPANGGYLYIYYITAGGATKYKTILSAGDYFSDDKYRGAVFAKASAAGQLCCAQEET